MQAATRSFPLFVQNPGRVPAPGALFGAALAVALALGGSPAFAACGGVSSVQNTGTHSASAHSGVHSGMPSAGGSTHGSGLSSCPGAVTISGMHGPTNGRANSAVSYHARGSQLGKAFTHLGSPKTGPDHHEKHP
jgi:hypothetical protein